MTTQAKSPPPDLPSLLLDARIVYLGMPLVSAVTELIIAELLYLQVITYAHQPPHHQSFCLAPIATSSQCHTLHLGGFAWFLNAICSIRTASSRSTCTSTAPAPLVLMANR
jgi:hypothetical protein